MRRSLAGLAGLLLAALAATVPSQAAPAGPVFTSVLLPGAVGSGEPRAAIADDGTHWVVTTAGNGDEVVYRSRDGLSWDRVTTPVGQTIPTIDVDIVTMPNGRVLTSELDTVGLSFVTTYSDDQGKTWTESQGQRLADTDRQWFAVGPPLPGDHLPRVYLLFHNLAGGAAQHNMFVATSVDGGASFGPPVPVATPPQQDYLDLQCADSGGPSNIFVNPINGKVSVVFGTRSSPVGGCGAQPVEVNIVAADRVWVVSADAADTATPGAWTPSLAVDDSATGQITGMQLAPGAVDDAGTYYVAYPESPHPYPDYDGAAIKVVHSSDLVHWSEPLTVAPAGGPGNVLPLIVAGDAGAIDVSWFHGTAEGSWRSYNAQVLDALSASPHVTTTALSDVPVEKGTASELMGACTTGATSTLNGFFCDRASDVNGIALDQCGRVMLTWPAHAGEERDGTYVSTQVGGPRLRKAACAQAVAVRPVPPASRPTKPTAGGRLAATGLPASLAGLAALLLVTGLVVRRRRA